MDSDAPVSRETWAPRSPPPASDRYEQRGPADDVDMRDSREPRGDIRERRDDREDRDARDPRDDRDARDPRDGRGRGDDRMDRREMGGPAPTPSRPPTAPNVDANPVLGVFGLSIRTRERDLEDEFSRFGDVEKVVIVYDQRTDRSRGFGFITMRSTEDATRCIEKLNGIVLHGRAIRVDYSATNKAHAPTPGEYRGEKRPFDDRFAPRRGPGGGGDRYGDRYDPRDSRDRRWGGDRGDRGGRWGGDRDDRRGGDRYGGGGDRYGGRGGDRYGDRPERPERPERGGDREEGGWGPRGGRDGREPEDPYAGRARRDDGERSFGREPRGDREDRRRTPSPTRFRPSTSPDRRPPPQEESRDY